MTAKTKERCPLCELSAEILEDIIGDELSEDDRLHVATSILTQVLHEDYKPKDNITWKDIVDDVAKELVEQLEQWDAHGNKKYH